MKHLGAVVLKHRQPLCRMSIQEYRGSGQLFRSVVFPVRRLKTLLHHFFFRGYDTRQPQFSTGSFDHY